MHPIKRVYLTFVAFMIFMSAISEPWYVTVAALGGVFALELFLGFLFELINMYRYRSEYSACVDAIRSKNDEWVDEVNRWTSHYYVRKHFSASASSDKVKVGYRYSLDSRR